jgi:O-acetyl-ADP-ribose deacetylase (regulator of RNase III)
MTVKVILADINPKMVQAWQTTFEENPEVDIIQGSMLSQQVDAWVTPTNSRGSMDGGLDAVIKQHLSDKIEKRVQQEIRQLFGGFLPVGHSTCVPTGAACPRFLISTPTMAASSEDISDSLNVALACAAAFQAVHRQNALQPGSIASVALPGLGANTGKVPVEICADLMWTGYNLFREKQFAGYAEMRAALEEQLGDLGPAASGPSSPPKKTTPGHATPPAVKKSQDIDFDDFE